MKSIRVSFSYRGKDYESRAKFKYENRKPELTRHKCNNSITCIHEIGGYSIYDHTNAVEIKVDDEMNVIHNIILWNIGQIDLIPLAILGEFENCKVNIKEIW